MAQSAIQNFVLEFLKPGKMRNSEAGIPDSFFQNLAKSSEPTVEKWKAALDYSRRIHAVAPFLTQLICSEQFQTLPQSIQNEFESALRQERMRLALLDHILDETLAIFQDQKIPTILLKGMDLGRRFYPERILRPMTDVDLLVPKSQYQKSIDCLIQAGFQIIGEQTKNRFRIELSKTPGGPAVELHYFLQEGDTPSGIEEIWKRAQNVPLSGLESFTNSSFNPRTLDPNDFLFYLIRHAGYQHLLESPGWLNDLHFLIQSPEFQTQGNWETLLKSLQKTQTQSAGYFILRFLNDFWDTPIPQEIFASLGREISPWKQALLRKRASPEKCFPIQGRRLKWVVSSRLLLRDTPWTAFQYGLGVVKRHGLSQFK